MLRVLKRMPIQFLILFVGAAVLTGATFIDIQLNQNMYLRSGGDPEMEKIGKVTKGSIISIAVPDQFVAYDSDKQINFRETLKNWAQSNSTADERPIHGTYKDDRDRQLSELFFPVRVSTPAPGSTPLPEDRQSFMALEFLAQRGNALVVTRDQSIMALKARPLIQTQQLATGVCNDADCFFKKSDPVSPKNYRSVQTVLHAAQVAEIDVKRESTFKPQGLTKSFPQACESFIKPNGEYGPYGQMVLNEISRYASYTSSANKLSQICPAFNNFSDEQKKNFFVWIYAALAAKESTCDPTATGKSKNGKAVGLFQMEGSDYRREKRDKAYGGQFCSGDIYDPSVNIRCTARIMHRLLNAGQGLYYTNQDYQYWGPFIVDGGLTKQLISQYRACSK